MVRFSYKIPITRSGGSLCINIPKRFVKELEMTDGDFVLPCIIDNQKILKKDPVLGNHKELVFKFRRNITDKLFEIFNETYGDDYD